jgi:hypothetical protein
MVGTRFYLFGMGSRTKLIYRRGELVEAGTGTVLRSWNVAESDIQPSAYRVLLRTEDDHTVTIWEDESGVWVDDGDRREAFDATPLRLPRFENHPRPALMRRLLHELLINVVNGEPVPNLFVYPKPWYRDAAMVALCFERTGHLDLILDWILGLREPFDRNNAGHPEPDNLGQVLALISLVSDASHPLVGTILRLIPEFRQDNHITGLTDFSKHPVYQTKWLKYGLRRLGLADPYEIPHVEDTYSTLFWMDYRNETVEGPRFGPVTRQNYPYLAWADAHFRNEPPPMSVDETLYPLTWEAHASQADYAKMEVVSERFVPARRCEPHAWHAAEMFLYYSDHPTS